MQDQETTEVTEAVSDEDKEDEGGHEVEDEGDVLVFLGFFGGFFVLDILLFSNLVKCLQLVVCRSAKLKE